jgi:hypothetical protein
VLAAIVAATGGRVDEADRASVAPHRHFVQTPNGLVEVGPRACDDPAARDAFARFHARVHGSATTSSVAGGLRGRVTTRACTVTG